MGRISLLAILVCVIAEVNAGSLRVDNTLLTLTNERPVAELTIRNIGLTPSLIQTEVYAWSQQANEIKLDPSQDLLVSPPIIEIPPETSQILRIGLLARASAEVELPYRLIIQEVPIPTDADDGVAVSVLLRISFPVFVRPKTKAEPQLNWQATRRSGNEITITLSNSGNAHAQVVDLDVAGDDGTPLVESDNFLAYVLPGETRSWNFATSQPWSGSRIKVSAETRQGRVHADLDLEGG